MDLSGGARLLVLAVVGCCFRDVCAYGEEGSEFTFLLQAGKSDCFFQRAIQNGTMEVEYQVIGGAGMDVDFTIHSPEGTLLVTESRRSDGVHVVEPTVEGDYQMCFDNSFSRLSEKMVFFELYVAGQGGDVGGDEEWGGVEELDENMLQYKLQDMREYMDSVHKRLERCRQMQSVLRAFEARDRNLLEDNLWRVSFWSCASLLVMLCVAITQVYTVRKLFDDKRRVCT
ncbi:transmembrane emp24 domain-containing protein 1b [Nerophis ophidion]|uniref:transmembrane emp24 domain-containing protein 1b n=1 Tax=Nerophis ophidion TaxID=159077 RepID=UPI002ADF1437|nr:transmembrane emp24 domain-containing protein 1b [Nerophis ophidion]XP_061844079.1 transmembrane emp24 domain-containing protein 1-like [Nerophis lumbriciformis]